LLGLLVSGASLSAQTLEEAGAGAPSAQRDLPLLSLPEIPQAAERAAAWLREIKARAALDPAVALIEKDLPATRDELSARAAELEPRLAEASTLGVLSDLQREWESRGSQISRWRRVLTGRATDLEATYEELARVEELWTRTEAEARRSDAPPAVLDRVRETLAAVRQTLYQVERRRAGILTLQNAVAAEDLRIAEVLARIEAEREALLSRVWVRDSAPLWQAPITARPQAPLGERIRGPLLQEIESVGKFAREYSGRFPAQLVLFLAAWMIAVSVRRRAERRAREDPTAEVPARIFERPLSAALVVALLATPWIYPAAPSVVGGLVGIMLLVPTLRLLHPLLDPPARPSLYALALFYLVDRLRDLTAAVPLLHRLLFTLELAGAILLLFWLLQPAHLGRLPARGRWLRWLRLATRVGLAVLIAALGANLLGYLRLALLLGEGILTSAYLGVVLYAAMRVFDGLVAALLRSRVARTLRAVQRHTPLLLSRIRRLVHVAALITWALATLGLLNIREPVIDAIRSVLTATLSVGTLDISLGDAVAFAMTVWLAFLFSRLLRFILDEEVYPRTELRRGIPFAISSTLHYAILLLGFFLAAGAAGFHFDRLALLVGAFGVGIGFGLQNVVNNFVSGLILLFERPVNVGDTVQMGDLLGEVKRIGIRSSTVRTWEGAEVIVPNANFISDQVTNWTLSDRQRRIDLPVGVVYGTDAERVLALLLDVARSHPRVLSEPAPSALFVGFGDSSLDFQLRAWTDRFEDHLRMRSELAVAVQRALREAGIAVPFPQRDLHVRTIDPSIQEALALPKRPGAEE
jgi:small-conductance mechanosensitive channel